jgi:hypothetical protein
MTVVCGRTFQRAGQGGENHEGYYKGENGQSSSLVFISDIRYPISGRDKIISAISEGIMPEWQ